MSKVWRRLKLSWLIRAKSLLKPKQDLIHLISASTKFLKNINFRKCILCPLVKRSGFCTLRLLFIFSAIWHSTVRAELRAKSFRLYFFGSLLCRSTLTFLRWTCVLYKVLMVHSWRRIGQNVRSKTNKKIVRYSCQSKSDILRSVVVLSSKCQCLILSA